MKAAEFGPFRVLKSLTRNWPLLLTMTRRDIAARYRGSMLGILWSVITPLVMLAVFDFMYTFIFKARWGINPAAGRNNYTLILFTGLILHQFFGETIMRTPSSVMENGSLVKKVIFPVEILPVMAVMTCLFNIAVSFVILLIGYLIFIGLPPITFLFLPFVLGPYVLFTIGVAWLLAAVGVYLRDIGQIMGVVSTILLFMSGVLFPLQILPFKIQLVALISPITLPIFLTRKILFDGKLPGPTGLSIYTLVAFAVAWFGWFTFSKLRDGFADVI